MKNLTRITFNPRVMGGKPCIRGLRVTVGTVVGLFASGHSFGDIIKAYPYLEEEDLTQIMHWKKRSDAGAFLVSRKQAKNTRNFQLFSSCSFWFLRFCGKSLTTDQEEQSTNKDHA